MDRKSVFEFVSSELEALRAADRGARTQQRLMFLLRVATQVSYGNGNYGFHHDRLREIRGLLGMFMTGDIPEFDDASKERVEELIRVAISQINQQLSEYGSEASAIC